MLLLQVLLFALSSLSFRVSAVEVVAEWTWIDVEYPTNEEHDQALSNGSFVPEALCPVGVKVFGGNTYLSVPRNRGGIPVTLGTLVYKDEQDLQPILRPFPSWEMQEQLDCEQLQSVQNIEYLPSEDELWIIDSGRIEDEPVCRPKLVVWSVGREEELYRYVFPESSIGLSGGILDDLAIDPASKGRFAFFTDSGVGPVTRAQGGLVVLDRDGGESWRLEHPSMQPEPDKISMTVAGQTFQIDSAVNGLALTPDGERLFYSALAGVTLYSVPTQALKDNVEDLGPFVSVHGEKASQGGGMYYGHSGLYYVAAELDSVVKWEVEQDREKQQVEDLGDVLKETEIVLGSDPVSMVWPDTLALSPDGGFDMYATANRLPYYYTELLTEDTGPNFRILRMDSGGDAPYLVEDD